MNLLRHSAAKYPCIMIKAIDQRPLLLSQTYRSLETEFSLRCSLRRVFAGASSTRLVLRVTVPSSWLSETSRVYRILSAVGKNSLEEVE